MQSNKERAELVNQLHLTRNKYGPKIKAQKKNLLHQLQAQPPAGLNNIKTYYDCLLFLLAYPDDKNIYDLAATALRSLELGINNSDKLQLWLYNSGVTGSKVCAAFGFEIVKWLRLKYNENVSLDSIEAEDSRILYILSVAMPKVESEILQDANATWKDWFKKSANNQDDLLDTLTAVFEQTDVRPEVKDELWNDLGINVVVNLDAHCALPENLFEPFYHNSLIKKISYADGIDAHPVEVKLSPADAANIIECGRMILVRHIREIDPVTFTDINLVSYYHLSRGISIALMGMIPDRRHPIDSYMGYVVFKNGLPVAYAGSWVLFDSARIGLNIFPAYRGGESQYIFKQILHLHQKVYRLKRFSVDPYQIGKENSDGIKSGAFWVYYHMGFRPIISEQKQIAEAEAVKIQSQKGYRSPSSVLKKLAGSRMELILSEKPVRFDATDLSIAYRSIIKSHFNNNRRQARSKRTIAL